MSSAKGSLNRKRPQKHQNKTAFKNDLHDTSHKTKFLNALEITGVCKRCKDVLEWKIKYKKYKPLTAPRKCVGCKQKIIKHAYHMLCDICAKEKNVCPKCCKLVDHEESAEEISSNGDTDLKSQLKNLPERKRRTILRLMNKDGIHELNNEKIADILSTIEKLSCDENSLFDGTFSDDSTNE